MPGNEVERLETWRKKRDVFEMRQKLVPYREIGEKLNLSVTTVRAYYQEMCVVLMPSEDIEEIRNRDIEGYDESERVLRLGVEQLAQQIDERKRERGYVDSRDLRLLGELEDKITNIRRARALLTGANKPVEVSHRLTVRTEFDETVEALTSELLGGGTLLSTPDDVLLEDQ